jgi:hypothetical protein
MGLLDKYPLAVIPAGNLRSDRRCVTIIKKIGFAELCFLRE